VIAVALLYYALVLRKRGTWELRAPEDDPV